MNKYTKCLIVIIISILISIPLISISQHARYGYVDNPGCHQRTCGTKQDVPTGEETIGWPLPICTETVGGMPGPDDDIDCSSYYLNSFDFNAIADCFIVFITIFIAITGIALLINKSKTAKNKSKKYPKV